MKHSCPNSIAAMKAAANVTRGTSWKKRLGSPSASNAPQTMHTGSAWSTSSSGQRPNHSTRGRRGCALSPRHQDQTRSKAMDPSLPQNGST